MTPESAADATNPIDSVGGRPLRMLPAYVVLALQAAALVVTITPSISNFVRFLVLMIGPLVATLLLLAWGALLSRARWWEVGAALGVSASLGLLLALVEHPTLGVTAWTYGAPLAQLGVVAAWLWGRDRSPAARLRATAVAVFTLLAPLACLRMEGMAGDYTPNFAWRWSQSAEDRFAASPPAETPAPASDWAAPSEAEWPGFRGPGRDSRAAGPAAPLDWVANPPREVWRKPVGPGWSSFAYAAGRLFTQEQRLEDELVSAYDAASGAQVWSHAEKNRFSDVVSGAGPRGTPTYADGRVFALGAKGVLVALDAARGALLWRHDLVEETDAELPVWGFSGSPLVEGEAVIVYAGGTGDNGLVAYNSGSGEKLWGWESHGMNFASAQAATIDGVRVVLFVDATGFVGLDPATGRELWLFRYPAAMGAPITQPQEVAPGSFVIQLGQDSGLARVDVKRDSDEWLAELRWESRDLKPTFDDFVYYQGDLYGFDQNLFACVDAETGKRAWKRGRYGFGQVLLLENAGQMIVTTERGDAVLLDADGRQLAERGRLSVLSGQTWNHPIVVGSRLFVRNGEEAVCLELVSESGSSEPTETAAEPGGVSG